MFTTKINNAIKSIYSELFSVFTLNIDGVPFHIEVRWNYCYNEEGISIQFIGYMFSSLIFCMETIFKDDDIKYDITVFNRNEDEKKEIEERIKTIIEEYKK